MGIRAARSDRGVEVKAGLFESIPTVLLLQPTLKEKCFHQISRLHMNRERERKSERARDCISGQCLLIGIQHTSPQLSQIAIEK